MHWKWTIPLLLTVAGAGLAGAQSKASSGAAATQVHYEYQVERPVRQAPNSPQPVYPAALKRRGIEAEVQAQFVVDTLGVAELQTLRIIKSPDDQFSTAVRDALPRMRYVPAEVGGRKVKQLVTQRFMFTRKS